MNGLPGIWYDGLGSQRMPVRIWQPMAGMLRVVPQRGQPFDLRVETLRISPRLGSTARILKMPQGGHLECGDARELDAWIPDRHRIEKMADWLERRWLAAIGAGLATIAGVVLFFTVGLPAIADRVVAKVPPSVEQVIGAQTMALLDRTALKPSRLPSARQQDLQAQFRALVVGVPRADTMRLDLRDAPGIGPNAFALPGGDIVMTDQLVALAKSDDELLAVLAHETGHHVHRHAFRMALENGGVAAMAGFLFGDVSGTGALSVSIPILLLNNGYSRAHEHEADLYAIALLRKRGHSPRPLADILRRLEAAYGGSPSQASYLSTHPPSEERIELFEHAAGEDDRRARQATMHASNDPKPVPHR